MKRTIVLLFLAAAIIAVDARPARADVTAFFGLAPTPAFRTARGFSVGLNMLIVGFEFEWANTGERTSEGAPGMSTRMFNGVLLTPTGSTQLYLSAGFGWFSETLGPLKETGIASNFGGGVKVKLLGPIRGRVDFRVFRLNDSAIQRNPVRIYAGLNIPF
jgi:hypothetical protein